MSTLALSAVGGLGREAGVAEAAYTLLDLVLGSESGEGGVDGGLLGAASTQSEHEVERGLLLDVVVGEGASVLELLAGEDEALLVGGDTLLVLNFGLHVVNGVGALHVQSNGLSGQSLHEYLHFYNNKPAIMLSKLAHRHAL